MELARWLNGLKIIGLMFIILFALASPVAAETDLRIESAVICRDVVDREPIGAGDVFPFDVTKLFCFTRIVGAEQDTEVTHNWYFDGKMVSSVTLAVRSANWRTYSSKKISLEQTGEWMVEILSGSGTPLMKLVFSVQ
jgi:hypothetical protein